MDRSKAKAPLVIGSLIVAASIPLIVMICVRTNEQISNYWSTHISATLVKIYGSMTSWIPFSVFEFGVIFAVLCAIAFVVFEIIALVKKYYHEALIGLLAVVLPVILLLNSYFATMGFGYYRKEYTLSSTPSSSYQSAELVEEIAEFYLNDFNNLAQNLTYENKKAKSPYTFNQLTTKLKSEFDRLNDPYLYDYTPTAKKFAFSWFMSEIMITGVSFLPTGEANVNIKTPNSALPATMAHELAHTKGVQREGDANLVAYKLLLTSQDDYLRYCGYYSTFSSILTAYRYTHTDDEYHSFYSRLNKNIIDEWQAENDYWQKQSDFLSKISAFFNDLYLKLNGAENGTGSYIDGTKSDVEVEYNPDTGESVVVFINYSDLQLFYFENYKSI